MDKSLEYVTRPRGEPFSELYFDIETSHMVVKTHMIGRNVSLHPHQIVKSKRVICISYLWNHEEESEVHSLRWDANCDDTKMLERFNKIAQSAPRLIGHNGENFDAKMLRWMMAKRHLDIPWCETEVFDTLKVYRRSFGFATSLRLDALGATLGVGRKISTDYSLWDRSENGDREALRQMSEYCDQDVILLRRVHIRLENYAKTSRNEHSPARLHQVDGIPDCPKCTHVSAVVKNGYTYRGKQNTKYPRFKCRSCGLDWAPGLPKSMKEEMWEALREKRK